MVNQELDQILALRVKVTQDVRELAQHYLIPAKPVDPKEVGSSDYIRKLADATAAVELVCSLVNVFGVMAGSKVYSGEAAIADLTFSLNTNIFWVKNAANLMPILSATVNAFLDNQKLKMVQQPIWNDLQYHHRTMWLEVLPAILLCLKGYSAMREQSLEMKQAFEKFIRAN